MKTMNFTDLSVNIDKNGDISVQDINYTMTIEPKAPKLGVMLVGMGGNNGSTLLAGLLAHSKKLTWDNKSGNHSVKFYGSVSQFGSVHIGYDDENNAHSKLFKDIGVEDGWNMCSPEDLVIGGWDICSDNMYLAAKKAQVIDNNLLEQLKDDLEKYVPLPSIYNPDFIAKNQTTRADNTVKYLNLQLTLKHLVKDITDFKSQNNLDKVIILWTASTERFHKGNWSNAQDLMDALSNNNPEISPSILFAMAAAKSGCIFLNGSPQNTVCPAVINYAKTMGTFVGGEDFKTGQTKIKSVLVDWLVSGGIKPLSIVSYNHLGNNDGKNLSEAPQFESKEITKKNVIDDVVDENPILFDGDKPDHAVVIKYVPAVGDSKRALDEYYSEIFLNGKHTLVMHNTCEDSLLAVPIILDIILFADFFSRVKLNSKPFNTVLSYLSIFFKAPVINNGEPLINAFFRQYSGLENFFRILMGLPPLSQMFLIKRI
jgi:myo-inositol-1-phosphate synthase